MTERTDRRRNAGPPGPTASPVFASYLDNSQKLARERPVRSRPPNVLRKMFLRAGVTPSASGSAYLELEPSIAPKSSTPGIAPPPSSGLKLTCTVHGPRPLPKNAPFSPYINLATHVKFAPFATKKKRGYLRDASERDLAVHLDTALRGVIIGDRWPKSSVEVIITILEGEEDRWWADALGRGSRAAGEWGLMSVLSGCITVASAAIADAGIDCVEVVSGGVAALVRNNSAQNKEPTTITVLDPVPSEHQEILAACAVTYLPARDEITTLWIRGEMGGSDDWGGSDGTYPSASLADHAVQAAIGSQKVLAAVLKETAEMKARR